MSTHSMRDRQWLAARRSAARALHPDRGGDPRAFIAALAAVDSAYGRLPSGSGDAALIVIVRRARWRRIIAAMSRVVRRIPGTRHHYAHL